MSWSSGSLTSSLRCQLAKEPALPSLGLACPIRSIHSLSALALALAVALRLPLLCHMLYNMLPQPHQDAPMFISAALAFVLASTQHGAFAAKKVPVLLTADSCFEGMSVNFVFI